MVASPQMGDSRLSIRKKPASRIGRAIYWLVAIFLSLVIVEFIAGKQISDYLIDPRKSSRGKRQDVIRPQVFQCSGSDQKNESPAEFRKARRLFG